MTMALVITVSKGDILCHTVGSMLGLHEALVVCGHREGLTDPLIDALLVSYSHILITPN